jgi:hypothetical protein
MALRSFGSGLLFATPTNGSSSSPVQFGTLQDVSLDLSRATKELYGQGQFAEAVGAAQMKITGKAKFGRVSGALYNSLFFGATLATGITVVAYNEPGTIPASTPFTVTVVNSVTWTEDLGVIDGTTGKLLTQVASGPTTGQYSVSAGVYTFAAADTGKKVLLSYGYSNATQGFSLSAGNPLQGTQPTFKVNLTRQYNGEQENVVLYSCIASKLSLPTKMADWGITEMDFTAFADASGNTIAFNTWE